MNKNILLTIIISLFSIGFSTSAKAQSPGGNLYVSNNSDGSANCTIGQSMTVSGNFWEGGNSVWSNIIQVTGPMYAGPHNMDDDMLVEGFRGELTYQWTPTVAGTYTFNAMATYWMGTISIATQTVTVSPPPNHAPSISYDGIAGSGANSGYNDSTYSFWGSCSDSDGNLSYVDVYVDGVNRGRATISGGSWSFSIAGTSIGGHSSYAIAYDTAGASTQTGTPSFTCYQRDPSVSIQILDSNHNVMGLNGNGRAQLTANQSFYIRINGYDPDARLATLYSRLNNPQGGAVDYPAVGVSGASASYDFGPYNVGTNLGVWNVWGHAYDHDSTNQSDAQSPDVEVVNTTNTTNWFTLNGNSSDVWVTVGQAVNVNFNASDVDGNMTYSLILWDQGLGGAGQWTGIDTTWNYQDGTGWSNYSSNHGYSINQSNNTITATFTPQSVRDYVIYPITWDNNWNAASGYTRTVHVSKASPSVSFPAIADTYVGNSVALNASVSGGFNASAPSYSIIGYSGGTSGNISGSTLNVTGLGTGNPGTITIRATYAGDANNNGGTYADRTVNVPNRAPVNQSMTATNVTVGQNTHITARSTDADGNLVNHHYVFAGPQFAEGNYWEGTSPSGHQWHHNTSVGVGNGSDSTTSIDYTMTVAGTYYMTLNSQDSIPAYTYDSNNVMATFTVSKASPSISFGSLANMNVGASTTLSASLNGGYGASGITYSVVSQNGATAHTSGSTLTIDGVTASPGQITVRASYTGDGNNNAASSVDQTVQVNAIGVSLTSATTQNFTFNGGAQGPSITWSNGSAVTSVTSGSLTATTAGNYSVSVSANYPYSGSGTIAYSIAKATPTVSWSTPAGITYGTALSGTQLNASASVGGSFVYSPASGSVLGAGNQTLSGNFTPTDTTNYNSVNGTTVTLAVAKANQSALTVSASPMTVSYGATSTLSTSNGSGSGAVSYSAPSGSISGNIFTATAGSGNVTVTATKALDSNYNAQTGTVTLTMAPINQSAVSITGAPSSLTYGTTSGALTAGGGSSTGAFTWSINSNGTLSSSTGSPTVTATTGTGTITVTLTKAGDSNYNSVTTSVNITAVKAPPTVSWSTPTAITYGTALNTQLNATASVPGSFVYTPASGTVLGAGIQTLTTNFTPSDTTNYNSVNGTTVSLTINKATPTITWSNPANITYGTALTATQLNATFSVPGNAIYAPALGTVLNAGSQTLSVSFTPSDSANYNVPSNRTVTLVVDKADTTATITPTTQTVEIGTTVTFTAHYTSTTSSWNDSSKSIQFSTVGTFNVTVQDPGDANHNPSQIATATITVIKKADSISTGTITSSAGTSVAVGTTVTVPATTSNGVALTYTFTSNGVIVPTTKVGNVFTILVRPADAGTLLDVTVDSAGDATNAPTSTTAQFNFTNRAPSTRIILRR